MIASLRRCATFTLVLVKALLACSCQNEGPACERCEFIFYWDSQGELSASDEECRSIDCAYAFCGVCYDIVYNAMDRPINGTCDSCTEDPPCGTDTTYCPMHPDECGSLGIPQERCGCVDLDENDEHCGACFNACTAGGYCHDGVCRH